MQLWRWVSFRKSGDRVLLIPAFKEIEADAWSRDEYAPPRYRNKQGTPFFDSTDYESLGITGFGFPPLSDIPNLEMREAVRLSQLEMPLGMFGEPPEIHTTKDKLSVVVAASEGEPGEHVTTIEEILRTCYDSREQARLREPEKDEEVIYLFVDAAEFSDWPALVKTNNGKRLLLSGELIIEPVSAKN